MASSPPLSSFIVRRYEVEEDGGSLQFWTSIQSVSVRSRRSHLNVSNFARKIEESL